MKAGAPLALRRHKYAFLLAALLFVTLVESFSQRLQHPLLSDFVMLTMMLLVFLIVFERRADRLVAFVASVTAATTFAADYVLCRTRRVRFAPSAVRRPSSR